MDTLCNLFRIGYGPSSSHTMAPRYAAELFLSRTPEASSYQVILYGSLASTGKGHGTDSAILAAFHPTHKPVDILWKPEIILPGHPNALTFTSRDKEGRETCSQTAYSTGGGALSWENDSEAPKTADTPCTLDDVLSWCASQTRHLWEYVAEQEHSVLEYLQEVWKVMEQSIKQGLESTGILPGGLNLPRKASHYYAQAAKQSEPMGKRSKIFAYALAVSEENAQGGLVVTAPTCGSSGVLPAVLYYLKETYSLHHQSILQALATAGLIGNIVKHQASISGAEVGCQGEIGTACAMASAAAAFLMGGSNYQVEYAAEMGLEHHLGLTCDPILGLVQIPCIERNALAAARALNHMSFSLLSDGRHCVSFDDVVGVMKETGQAIPSVYRETSLAGLASISKWKKNDS